MKKFLRVRNIIILLIVIVAIAVFLYMKQDDVYESKAYKYLYNVEKLWKYSCTLDDKKEHSVKEVYARDNENGSEYLKVYFSKEQVETLMKENNKKDPNADYHAEGTPQELNNKYIKVSNENGKNIYWILDNEKLYYKMDEPDLMVAEFSICCGLIGDVSSAKGYMRGFEFIEGKLLYFESFTTTESGNVKLYFEDDKIKYVKFDNYNLLELTVECLDKTGIPKEWTKIPEDYKDGAKVVIEE